jgi:hypothetical protein
VTPLLVAEARQHIRRGGAPRILDENVARALRPERPHADHCAERSRKTVVIYIESIFPVQKKFSPVKLIPTFLPYAQKMLAGISFS